MDDYYDESYADEARDRTMAFVRLSPGAQAARDAISECMALGWDDPDKPTPTGPTTGPITGPITTCAMCGKPSGRLAPPWDFCHKCQQADLAD